LWPQSDQPDQRSPKTGLHHAQATAPIEARSGARQPFQFGAERDLARLLAPDISPTLARLVLGRSAYTSAEERNAETLASMILGQAIDSPPQLPARAATATAVLYRMEHAWGR
jgi:hypothetical protein